jgi:hypothetical protein
VGLGTANRMPPTEVEGPVARHLPTCCLSPPRSARPYARMARMSALASDPKRPKRSQIQLGAAAFGVVFLLVGIAGFIPGVTFHFMNMGFAGRESSAKLLGIFQVSVLHNLVHLLYGVAGLVLSSTPLRARNFLFYGGIVYGVLFFYGIVTTYGSPANFVPFNAADNALHIALAVAMMTASLVLDRGPSWAAVLEEGKAQL